MGLDFHGYQRRLESKLNKIRNSEGLCEENKSDILKFKEDCISEGLTIPRIEKLVSTIRELGLMLKIPFRSVTKEDIKGLVRGVETREKWSEWTKHDYKAILKKFYKWLRNSENHPPEVSWIKCSFKNKNHRLPEEILTQEEIKRMVEVSDNPRDKALLLVLYDSGCRIGELVSLRIKHVQFDEYGSVLLVNGKTGSRRVRLIASAPVLSNWIEQHPFKEESESSLWLTKFNRMNRTMKKVKSRPNYYPLDYAGIRRLLKILAKRAGVKKRVNPHSFRHARATHLANNLTEAQMKEYFGWTQGSEMASIYVHLSGRDVDNALLKMHGLVKEEKKDDGMQLRICERCQEKNSPTQQFCGRCGSPLDLKIALETEEKIKTADEVTYVVIKKLIETNPEIEKQIFKVIKDLKLEEKLK